MFIATLAAFPLAVAADYTLSPGDEIELSISELPDSAVASRIDIDGRISFPRLGSFQASGLTLDELRNKINLEAAGKVISVYTLSGEWFQVTMDGTGIYLGIESYQPVFVTGDVAQPGPVAFIPGMTVRTAIASGGGVLSSLIAPQEAILNAPTLKSNLTTLAIRHANLVAELWSLNALIERDADLSIRGLPAVSVDGANFDALLVSRGEQVRLTLTERETEKGHLAKQLSTLSRRIDLLRNKLENQELVLEIARDEVSNAEALLDKGLARATTLSNAQQSLLAISSSVLEVEGILAELELQRNLIEQRIEVFDSSYDIELLNARASIEPEIKALASQIQGAQESLVLNDGGAGSILRQFQEDLKLYLIRRDGDEVTTKETGFDNLLRPGDVVEVDNIILFPESSIGRTRSDWGAGQ
ncbi:MAG: polysaccharide biosynthesis/export family protein [Pseudomonadota bacterium]